MGDNPITLDAARSTVLKATAPLPTEWVPLDEAQGRVAASDIDSVIDVPGFDSSAMDGFAVRAADVAAASERAPVRLAIAGESRAGRPASRPLGEGETIAISTGAMLPEDASAVVRREDVAESDGAVELTGPVDEDADIRRAGEGVRRGERVVATGTALGPAELGVLASIGVTEVECSHRPGLALVVTGDELVEPGVPLGPGQIHNSNLRAVAAQARAAGCSLVSTSTVGDDYARTVTALRDGLRTDVLVVCGGVSVGAHDHVKEALAELGVEERFWGIALRPGGPTWFGVHEGAPSPDPPGRTLVFGLPGNPVSAMVTFQLLVRPAVERMTGAGHGLPPRLTAKIDAGYRKRPGKLHAIRCIANLRDDGWHVRPTGPQGSHILTSMLGAGALAMIEADRGDIAAGETVEIELL
jgi:molybdopterin molybdotransferase